MNCHPDLTFHASLRRQFSQKKKSEKYIRVLLKEKIKLSAIVCIDCVSENRHVTAWAILRY